MFKTLNKFKYEIIIFLLFIFSRSFDLGHDMFNTDVWKWKARSYDFSTGIFTLNFELTNQKYHPGVTLMWLGTVGIKIFNLYNDIVLHQSLDSIISIFGLHTVQKYLVVIVIGLVLSSIFYVLKNLFGNKYALLSVFLISTEPFYVALTRVFHLEGMQSTFMLGAIVWFYYWFEYNRKNYKRLFIASLFSSLAFLTKTSALYLIPFFGLWLLISLYKGSLKNRSNLWLNYKNYIFYYLIWLIPSLIFVFLLWPALWVDPISVFNTLYRGVAVVGVERDHEQYFFGKLVEDPGWYFYLIVLLFRSSYLLIIGLISSLIFFFSKNHINKINFKTKSKENILAKYISLEKNKFILYNLLYILFYFVMLSIPSKKLDRYILPLMLSCILISVVFFEYYLDKIKTKLKYLLFLIPVFTLVYIHPNYLSYYSTGLRFGMYAIEPKWMIGQKEIIQYFTNLKAQNGYIDSIDMSFEELVSTNQYQNVLSVGFPEKYYTQIWPFFRQINSWAVIQDIKPFAVKTNYFVYPVWADESALEDRFKLKFIDTINIRGVDTYNVYQRVNN